MICCGRLFQICTTGTGKKLRRCRLRVGYGEQTVRETKRNTDAFKTPTLLDDEVRQRGIPAPGREDRITWSPPSGRSGQCGN